MSYVIFRVQPINTVKDLGVIGAHNTRSKEAYTYCMLVNEVIL